MPFAHILKQLGDFPRAPPRIIFREQICCRAPDRFFVIQMSKRLPGTVAHDKASGRFHDRPRRRKAAAIEHAHDRTLGD